MDTETKFEMWRTHQVRGTPCPNSLKSFVWYTANESCAALEKRVEGKVRLMGATERMDFRNDLILRFLEFITDKPEKSIGWCFKTFKMRFPNVVTEIEAKNIGLGVNRSKGIQTDELKKLGKQLAKNRKGEGLNPILMGLTMTPITFDEEAVEVTESGTSVDWKIYNVNRHRENKWHFSH